MNLRKHRQNYQALLIRPTTESSDTKSQPGTYASPNALGSRLYQGELFRQRRGYLRKLVRNTKDQVKAPKTPDFFGSQRSPGGFQQFTTRKKHLYYHSRREKLIFPSHTSCGKSGRKISRESDLSI